MKAFLVTLSVAVVFLCYTLTSIPSVSGLECWNQNGTRGDFNMKAKYTTKDNCSVKGSVNCIKIGDGKVFSRRCGNSNSSYNNKCLKEDSSNGYTITTCYCATKDYCNAASDLRSMSLFSYLSVTSAVAAVVVAFSRSS